MLLPDADKNAIYDVEEFVYDDRNLLVESIKLVDKEGKIYSNLRAYLIGKLLDFGGMIII